MKMTTKGVALIALVSWAAVLILPAALHGAVRWLTVSAKSDNGEICLAVGGDEIGYKRLDHESPVVMSVRGPRRVKILSRYIYGPGERGSRTYEVRVVMDGDPILSKTFHGGEHADIRVCGDETAPAGGLRRSYVDVPVGWHELAVTASDATGDGLVAARFYRASRSKREELVSYAPETYSAVTHLQFESGTRSTYYCFTASQPLTCDVTGPTTLTIWTRLDFDQYMSGSQPYTLEVLIDGNPWRTFHYDVQKLSAAAYTDRPGVMPSERKTLRLPLGKGRHRVELRCVRPENCGISAKIRIPARDLR